MSEDQKQADLETRLASLAQALTAALSNTPHTSTSIIAVLAAVSDLVTKSEGVFEAVQDDDQTGIAIEAGGQRGSAAPEPPTLPPDVPAVEHALAVCASMRAWLRLHPHMTRHRVHAGFYASHFERVADAVLSAVAPSVADLTAEDGHQCLYSFFLAAPPPVLACAVARHMRQVEIQPARASRRASARVVAPSSLVAQELLCSTLLRIGGMEGEAEQDAETLHSETLGALEDSAALPESRTRGTKQDESHLVGGLRHLLASLDGAWASAHAADVSRSLVALADLLPASGSRLGPLWTPSLLRSVLSLCVGEASDAGECAFAAALVERLAMRGFCGEIASLLWKDALRWRRNEADGAGDGPSAMACWRVLLGQFVAERGAAPPESNSLPAPSLAALEKIMVAILTAREALTEENLAYDQGSGAAALKSTLLDVLFPEDPRFPPGPRLRSFLTQRLISQCVFPPSGAKALALRLSKNEEALLMPAVRTGASLWAGASSRNAPPHASSKKDAYCACLLDAMLRLVPPGALEADGVALPSLLKGVGLRLESPDRAVRIRAMRVGRAASRTLGAQGQKPLFEGVVAEEELEEDYWEAGAEGEKRLEGSMARGWPLVIPGRLPKAPPPAESEDDELTASACSDSDDERSEDDLDCYDEVEEDNAEDSERSKLQLRDLITLLGKGEEDWRGQLRALQCAEALISSRPDELFAYAAPLGRALLRARLPAWAAEETDPGAPPPDAQRFRALVATAAAAPRVAGLALAGEFYSPHLDIHQRCLLLSALGGAAQELVGAGRQAEGQLGLSEKVGRVQSGPPRQVQSAGPLALGRDAQTTGRVLWRAERSLALRRSEAVRSIAPDGPPPPHPVILQWAVALLRDVDKPQQGVDLFRRDAFLLGRLLVTLGTFLESVAGARESATLAHVVMELVAAEPVSAHAEPYVQRAAVLAVAQACASLPASVLGQALYLSTARSLGSAPPAEEPHAALAARLEWAGNWLASLAEGALEESVRSMARSAAGILDASLAAGRAELERERARNESLGMWGGRLAARGQAQLEVALPSRAARLSEDAAGNSALGTRRLTDVKLQ